MLFDLVSEYFSLAVSMATAVVLLFLCDQNSGGVEPHAKKIASGYGVLGVCVLVNALFRQVPEVIHFLPWSIWCSRLALLWSLFWVSRRLNILKHEVIENAKT